jgi:hypothetical protein
MDFKVTMTFMMRPTFILRIWVYMTDTLGKLHGRLMDIREIDISSSSSK